MIKEGELKKIRKVFNDEKESFLTNSFKALGDINRHRIFQVLMNKTKMSASDIAETLQISRPLASQHLKILEQAQLFSKTKVGQKKYYQLDKRNRLVKSIVDIMKKTG